MPMFAISIALEREGQLVAGLVYNPATDETFTWPRKGQGAWYNDRRLRVSARRDLCAMRWSAAACRISARRSDHPQVSRRSWPP
jgi:myo-inositol-1(or 4)-monophosphatase